MASKKNTGTKASTTTTKKPAAPKATSTAVRHTAIPRVAEVAAPAATARPAVTGDMIAARAYEIWSSNGGCEVDNWLRAESELRAA